jgi:hypothetical protein
MPCSLLLDICLIKLLLACDTDTDPSVMLTVLTLRLNVE